MEPADIGRITAAGSPAVSPDGQTVAFVVARVDLEANRSRSAVWLAAADGSAPPYQFTSGEHGDGAPAWSPDGRRLAFTSKRGDGGKQSSLHVAPVGPPGETVLLAERAEGFGDLAWSPDGSRIAFTSRVPAADVDDDRARPARRIDRLLSRIDGEGWIIDRPSHVFVVPVDGTAPPRQLTDGPYEHSGPRWSPDGTELACISARQQDWDLTVTNDVYVLAADGSSAEPVAVTDGTMAFETFSWGPDGPDRFALVGAPEPEVDPSNARVLVLDRASGTTVDLTAGVDRTAAPYSCTRPPVWDGERVVFAIDCHGAVRIMAAPADGSGEAVELVPGDRATTGYDVRGGTVAFTASTPDRLAELFVADPSAAGGVRRLSTVTDSFHAACPAHPTTAFTVPCRDGSGDIDAWIVLPDGVDPAAPDAKVPTLLSVHGGPFTQYVEGWFDEFQLWASAGFAVVFCNPRGSSGQSEVWGRAIRSSLAERSPGSGWGGVDVEDVLAVVDAALERWPGLDGDRLGMLGGSYGGFMATWLAGTTDRFKALCSERAVNNLLTLETASDAAGFFRHVFGVSHLDQPEDYLAHSPMTHVRGIDAPLLILHSENDLRCPVEQADQLFVALRLLGKEVEYHRFPGEGHELSRSGAPKHRVQRAELIIDFFRRHLQA